MPFKGKRIKLDYYQTISKFLKQLNVAYENI